jgi:hydrogenase maturation protein HypF
VRCLLVQHHHAHLASLLAEHQVAPGRPVLGFTFDGTGFGTDGTVWGGEVLLGSYAHVDRVGHLAPVQLPGGDAAVQRPARMALSHLHAARLSWDSALPGLADVDPVERRVVAGMLRSGSACLPTTSMGRLFDAVAVLAGVGGHVTYEGQAAIELEALSQAAHENGLGSGSYGFEVGADLVLDATPVVAQCVEDVLAGVPAGVVGLRFHRAVAAAILLASERIRRCEGVRTVGLTGGVFQNLLLVRLTREMLEEHGFEVLTHRVVPPNDGGLALGQVAVAASGGAKEAG